MVGPPRKLAAGDIVTTFCDELGEWSAAQVVAINPRDRQADVVDLNWSGPEPHDISDLGELLALKLTHHGYDRVSQSHREWVLPRSYKNLGSAPLVLNSESRQWTVGWAVGIQLHWQRRWDAGERGDFEEHDPRDREYVDGLEMPSTGLFPQVRSLTIETSRSIDASHIANSYPNLIRLTLLGDLGELTCASRLGQLRHLRRLEIVDMFGMTAGDVVLPHQLTSLEFIALESVPAEYANAMRTAWSSEANKGVYLSISKARQAQWVQDNVGNPLRSWKDKTGISDRTYKRAIAAWKESTLAIRQTLLSSLDDELRRDQLMECGKAFAHAFSQLGNTGLIIETEERDELLEALHAFVVRTETASGVDREEASDIVLKAVNRTRDW